MRGSASRGIKQGFTSFTRPVFPSPTPPGWNQRRFGFPPELRTPPLPATHVRGGDRPSSTDLELPLNSHPSISNPIVHSYRATSRRTAQTGEVDPALGMLVPSRKRLSRVTPGVRAPPPLLAQGAEAVARRWDDPPVAQTEQRVGDADALLHLERAAVTRHASFSSFSTARSDRIRRVLPQPLREQHSQHRRRRRRRDCSAAVTPLVTAALPRGRRSLPIGAAPCHIRSSGQGCTNNHFRCRNGEAPASPGFGRDGCGRSCRVVRVGCRSLCRPALGLRCGGESGCG